MKLLFKYIVMLCMITQLHASQASSQAKAAQTTVPQAIAAGTVAGVAEVGIAGHALSYMINRVVQGEKFSVNPSMWKQPGIVSLWPRDVYRGMSASAVGMGGITAIQVAGTSECKKAMEKHLNRELTGAEVLVPPVAAGMAAGAIVAPVQEGVPNYQQNVQKQEGRIVTAWQATKELYEKYGVRGPWRAAVPTGVRDGMFTAGYKVLPTMIEEQAKSVCGDNAATKWGSKLAAGVVTAVATHPWHVAARYMQNNRNIPHTWAAMRDITQKDGLKAFAKGLVPRGARVIIAIPVLSWVEEEALKMLKKR